MTEVRRGNDPVGAVIQIDGAGTELTVVDADGIDPAHHVFPYANLTLKALTGRGALRYMRDERLEAFSTLLWEGVYDYNYIARATTPGTFVAPPTKAEEMYAPETFGRSGSDVVIVE